MLCYRSQQIHRSPAILGLSCLPPIPLDGIFLMLMNPPTISVFIPACKKASTIPPLFEKIARAFDTLNIPGEIIFVDDGSTDSTWNEANALTTRFPFAHLFRHRGSRGLTEMMRTGFRHCRGDVVIFLPPGLECDPEEDVPKLYAKLSEGFDVVAGWRQGQRDRQVFTSAFANLVSRRVFGLTVHDMDWIKAGRREVIENLRLHSDWPHYLLILAAAQGYSIAEVPVNYYPRALGKSHESIGHWLGFFQDVLVIKFLLAFSRKPMLFFGGIGLLCVATSIASFATLAIMYLVDLGQRRPIYDFAGVLLLAGLLFFVVGFIAELIVHQNERVDELERRLRNLGR